MKTRKRNEGFTLVEILIVVVILGILAAIVIPQFTQASTEAKTASLQGNLRMMRSQIELWKINNGDLHPATLQELVDGDPDGKVYIRSIPNDPFTNLPNWSYSGDPVTGTGEIASIAAGYENE